MRVDWGVIEKLAKNIRRVGATNTEYLRKQLEIWWSIKFNRPLKDPLLQEYSLYELLYEYLLHYHLDPNNEKANKEKAEKSEKEDLDWAKKMIEKIGDKAADLKKTKDDKENGTDGMFITPSEVPDIPFPDLPDTISSNIDE